MSMTARAPEELHALIEAAFNSRDLDAFAELYEDGATQVIPPDGRRAAGKKAILGALEETLAVAPEARLEVLDKIEVGEIALTYGRWTITGTANGRAVEMSGRGTMVSRRQPDGSWRIVLDNPMAFERTE
jgi:uncharacterized protein (TIGR02246 family)